VTELPTAYAVAVRLREGGADRRAIAVALGIDEDEVGSLLEIAEAKLASLVARAPLR
jgi:hypothetical protein